MKQRSFSALLSVIIMGSIVTLMAISLLNLGGDSQQISQVLTASYNAKSLSKSCAEKAIAYIRNQDDLNLYETYQARKFISATKDAMIRSTSQTFNYGVTQNLALNNQSYLLFEFDIADSVPTNAVITEARLKLFSSADQPNSATLSLYRIMPANRDWYEGTRNGEVPMYGCSWLHSNYGELRPWAGSSGLSSVGIDHYALPEASLHAPVATSTVYEFVISSSTINSWKTAADNAGLILKTDSAYWHWFSSREHTNVYQRPQLDITYQATDWTINAGGVVGDQGYCYYEAETDGLGNWTIESTGISHETWSRERVTMVKSTTTDAISITTWKEVTSF